MKKHPIFLILILFSLFISSCKYDYILPGAVAPISNVSFLQQVVPIFAQKCISCHSTQTPVLKADVAFTQLVPNYVNTATPADSKIYTVPKSGTHGGTVTDAQAEIILQWIKEGAKNN
jgi:hypothetical protein